ncbi:MAG: HAD family hydrolase [Lachnospiraceae bacterium]|nr:HAD family hydrolase [Lachnospiraceae bacterium]
MEKILYVTDLDGTLLNKKERINKKSIDIINELVEKGMMFTYATARSLVSASVVTAGLTTRIPVIAYNGAFIFQPATGAILSQERFSREEMNCVSGFLSEHNISVLVYSYIQGIEKVSWISGQENEGIRRYLDLRKGDRRLRPVANQEELYQGDIFYFTCVGEKDELQPVYDIFSKDARYRCTIQQELYRPEYFCEIMPAGATKAHAIEKLKKIWSCDKVISFGDAVNDIPMFEISDESYAVENAVEELKAVASGIIESNENDGVANWLKEHYKDDIHK